MKKLLIIVLFGCVCSFLLADWTIVETPQVGDKWSLNAVSFPAADTGWAVGYDYSATGTTTTSYFGIILKYEGSEWMKEEIPQPSDHWSLFDVHFVSPEEGWAVGADLGNNSGALLHYINGNWNVVEPPEVGYAWWQLYGVRFLNENEGWAVGGAKKDGAVLLHYHEGEWIDKTDYDLMGGHTLLTAFPIEGESLWTAGFKEGLLADISMGSHARGTWEIKGWEGAWEEVKQPLLEKNVICEDYYFFDEDDGWKVGWMPAFQSAPDTGKLLKWNGKKWKKEKLDGPKGWTLRAIDFSDNKTGWAVGMNTKKDNGLIFEFKKGKWSMLKKKQVPKIEGRWELKDVNFDGSATWWAIGANYSEDEGIILKYTK
ncbi:hypothetical protein ACFLYJ_03165 [Candidatus Cloacimonadota bacterium]